MKHNSSGNGIY